MDANHVFSLALLAAVFCWVLLGIRRAGGTPLVRHEDRPTAPWRGIDVLAVVVLFLAVPELANVVRVTYFALPELQGAEGGPTSTVHPLAVLLLEDKRWTTILLCGLSAVVVAPIVEEFFFRVILQGWLERIGTEIHAIQDAAARGHVPEVDQEGADRAQEWEWNPSELRVRASWVPILAVSAFFASLHMRTDDPTMRIDQWRQFFLFNAIARVLALGLAVTYLRHATSATWRELGWSWGTSRQDIFRGLVASVAVVAPILGLNSLLAAFLAERTKIVADPIPLFFFSLALGYLFQRTGRLMPSVVLHSVLNSVSLVAVALGGGVPRP
jgi:membrane protease YdiL (CAAX protease family)